MQLYDLGYKIKNINMDFKKVAIENNIAEVNVYISVDYKYNVGSDKLSGEADDHTIKLEKINNNWLICSESSQDFTKQDLLQIVKKGKTAAEAKAEVLELSKKEVEEKRAMMNSTPKNESKSKITPQSLQPYNASYAAAFAYQYAYLNNPSPYMTYSYLLHNKIGQSCK